MWEEWMDDDCFKEQDKRINEELELEEKIDKIAHPLKHKIIDAKDRFAVWLLRL